MLRASEDPTHRWMSVSPQRVPKQGSEALPWTPAPPLLGLREQTWGLSFPITGVPLVLLNGPVMLEHIWLRGTDRRRRWRKPDSLCALWLPQGKILSLVGGSLGVQAPESPGHQEGRAERKAQEHMHTSSAHVFWGRCQPAIWGSPPPNTHVASNSVLGVRTQISGVWPHDDFLWAHMVSCTHMSFSEHLMKQELLLAMLQARRLSSVTM
jgi:hypothetical protein